MTNADTSIVTAFEELGMSPEEIAEDQQLDLSAVKASLMQFSIKYKNILMGINGAEDKASYDFKEAELKEANNVILDLMRWSEDDRIRAKLAMYVRDDKLGRLDAKQALLTEFNNTLNVNVLVFNERLQKAKEAKKRSITVDAGTANVQNGESSKKIHTKKLEETSEEEESLNGTIIDQLELV